MIQNPDTQVANCCRAIVRYINGKKLKAGDKLPSQEEFRQLLDFSHNSVTPAMNLLVESGMIERKRRVGTVLVDPDAVPAGLWRIALALGLLDDTPWCKFETMLSRYIQEKIQRGGCYMRSYFLNFDKFDVTPHSLSDFGLLETDIQAGRIDALISPAFFSSKAYDAAASYDVPLCNVGGWEQIPFRVEFDKKDILSQAFKILKDENRKNIAIIMDSSSDSNYAEFIKSHCASKDADLRIIHGNRDEDAIRIADMLLQEETTARPDALIILNDMLTLALTSILSKTKYEPRIIVQSNKQIALFYPMPVISLEFDMEELADTGVKMVLGKVKGRDMQDSVKTLNATRRDNLLFSDKYKSQSIIKTNTRGRTNENAKKKYEVVS